MATTPSRNSSSSVPSPPPHRLPPPSHVYYLIVVFVRCCRRCRRPSSTSTSASRLYEALPPSRVLLQRNLCLSSAGFRDAIASCLLAPPLPFASRSPAGCRDASRSTAAAASCPLDEPASFRGTIPSCLPLVCQLVVTLMPPPLVLLTRPLRLLMRNLCLLTPRRLFSTGASPPVCLLFADWFSCCLLPRLQVGRVGGAAAGGGASSGVNVKLSHWPEDGHLGQGRG
jgi:hypothetical protein